MGDEFAPAFEAVLGWNVGNGTDVRGRLNYYSHDESETITTDGSFVVGGTWGSTVPDVHFADGFAQGRLDRRVISGGVEIGKTLAIGDDLSLRISTGVESAALENKISVLFVDRGPTFFDFSGLQVQDNDIRGVGGRLGLAGDWHMTSNFSVGMSLGAALLYAQRDYKTTNLRSTNSRTPTNPSNLKNFSTDESFVMPAFDLEAAVTYRTVIAGFPTWFSLGYGFQTWLDAIKDVRGASSPAFTTTSHDLTLDGPFVRVGVSAQ